MEIPFRQPHIPAQPASPLQNNEAAQNLEDDEEWEYEYSETETEVSSWQLQDNWQSRHHLSDLKLTGTRHTISLST